MSQFDDLLQFGGSITTCLGQTKVAMGHGSFEDTFPIEHERIPGTYMAVSKK